MEWNGTQKEPAASPLPASGTGREGEMPRTEDMPENERQSENGWSRILPPNRKKKIKGHRKFGRDEFLICILLGILCLVIAMPSDRNIFRISSQKESAESSARNVEQNTDPDLKQALRTESSLTGAAVEAEPIWDTESIDDVEAIDHIDGGTEAYARYMEYKLEQALSAMEGAGSVKAIVTLSSSQEIVVEKDRPVRQNRMTETDAAGGSRETEEYDTGEETIYRQKEDGSSLPYIVKMLPPTVKGVVIIAQGGNRREIVKNITEAVVALFDIEPHKIKVVKMKSIERKEE